MIVKFLSSIVMPFAVFLAGCHAFQNLTVRDIEQEEYFYKEYSIKKSLDGIENSLYQYTANCRPLKITRNPAEKNKAKGIFLGPGLTAVSSVIMVVLDFWETGPNSTRVKAYSYYSTWHYKADKVIKAIESPDICD